MEQLKDSSENTMLYKVRFNLGITLRKERDLEQSITQLIEAIKAVPNKATAHNNLGLSYFEDEKFQDALEQFSKSIQIES